MPWDELDAKAIPDNAIAKISLTAFMRNPSNRACPPALWWTRRPHTIPPSRSRSALCSFRKMVSGTAAPARAQGGGRRLAQGTPVVRGEPSKLPEPVPGGDLRDVARSGVATRRACRASWRRRSNRYRFGLTPELLLAAQIKCSLINADCLADLRQVQGLIGVRLHYGMKAPDNSHVAASSRRVFPDTGRIQAPQHRFRQSLFQTARSVMVLNDFRRGFSQPSHFCVQSLEPLQRQRVALQVQQHHAAGSHHALTVQCWLRSSTRWAATCCPSALPRQDMPSTRARTQRNHFVGGNVGPTPPDRGSRPGDRIAIAERAARDCQLPKLGQIFPETLHPQVVQVDSHNASREAPPTSDSHSLGRRSDRQPKFIRIIRCLHGDGRHARSLAVMRVFHLRINHTACKITQLAKGDIDLDQQPARSTAAGCVGPAGGIILAHPVATLWTAVHQTVFDTLKQTGRER